MNTGVQGRVVDENGSGIGGLEVVVYDREIFDLEDRIGDATTAPSGHFSVTYSDSAYGPFESKPDLKVRIFDPVGRTLFESVEYPNVIDKVLQLGQVVVPGDVLRGFRITLRQGYLSDAPLPAPLDPFPLLTDDNHVEVLLDNESAWAHVTQAVEQATSSVHMVQLWFNADRFISEFNPPTPLTGKPTTGTALADALLEANRLKGVEVRLLLNDFQFEPGLLDSVIAARNYFEDARKIAPHSVRIQSFPRPYNTPLHAKMMIVDGKSAYVIGSPFVQNYFDDTTHSIRDARRGKRSYFEPTVPLHDVSAVIRGPAVEQLNDTFRDLWNSVAPAIASSTPPAAPAPNVTIQLARTIPGNLIPTIPAGETGILEGYLRAIREAQEFIFLDNQYFTEPIVAEALAKALNAHPTLQVIMVLNGRVDIPFYNSMQPNLINKMLGSLNSNARSRIGLFTLWSHENGTSPQRISQIYTHAKVGIVDDGWATIGSANLDGVSLRLSQHVIPPVTDRDRLEERAIEVNAVFFDGVDGLPASPVPSELRRTVWADHLGYSSPTDPALVSPPPGGWLALWRDRAAAKLAALATSPPVIQPAHILEWRAETDPVRHLRALGLTKTNLSQFKIETVGGSFDFATGTWK